MSGVISDRLRALFAASDPVWTPPRGEPAQMAVPKGVDGQQLKGRKR